MALAIICSKRLVIWVMAEQTMMGLKPSLRCCSVMVKIFFQHERLDTLVPPNFMTINRSAGMIAISKELMRIYDSSVIGDNCKCVTAVVPRLVRGMAAE